MICTASRRTVRTSPVNSPTWERIIWPLPSPEGFYCRLKVNTTTYQLLGALRYFQLWMKALKEFVWNWRTPNYLSPGTDLILVRRPFWSLFWIPSMRHQMLTEQTTLRCFHLDKTASHKIWGRILAQLYRSTWHWVSLFSNNLFH